MDGLELIEALRQQGPLPPLIVITGHADVAMAVRAMKLGARDFLEKPFDPDRLVGRPCGAVRPRVAGRERGSRARPPAPDADAARARGAGTARVGALQQGIARTLRISPRTVEVHRARVMAKMAAESLSQLVRMALRAGIDPDPA